MQSLKYTDSSKYKVDDKFKIEIPDIKKIDNKNSKSNGLFSGLSDDFWEKSQSDSKKDNNESKPKVIITNLEENKNNIDDNLEIKEGQVEFINSRESIKLTNIEKTILEKFKLYNLKKVDLHPRLFDLTWEYPDDYFEYYWNDMSLYFFWNKSYIDLRDIFEVLTYELPFKLKEVNNFWTSSFYINLDTLFEDDYIRIVIQKSNRTFWLKIKKELYSKIKNDLSVIFTK